ncbi:MAG: hypothetical protein HN826_05950 [Methylococcales bacterium]|nr:hypothetical protein [Methylococcales bacterium]
MKIEKLERVFQFGSIELKDLKPDASVEESVMVYEDAYPFIKTATISAEPEIQKNKLVYRITPPTVKTKGLSDLFGNYKSKFIRSSDNIITLDSDPMTDLTPEPVNRIFLQVI